MTTSRAAQGMPEAGLPLVAERLTKVIGRRTIVRDVSFELHAGEVFGFLGPNGAGKTTTIRMLVGLIAPTSGRVLISGYDVQRDPERALRHIGCIVETPDLYRFMTGRENLEHFARMLGRVDGEEIDRLAELVFLSQRLDDRVSTYSLGMRQRLGIAQALLGAPRVLILDEPANGLDPAGIREMRELLRSLAHGEGITVLVSSHLLAEVELMCDRVSIIHRGAILRTGRLEELVRANQRAGILVDDAPAALQRIRALGYDAKIFGQEVVFQAGEEEMPALVQSLCSSGVKIFRAGVRSQTLEEMFLDATGEETVV